jgi:hypothetical protein
MLDFSFSPSASHNFGLIRPDPKKKELTWREIRSGRLRRESREEARSTINPAVASRRSEFPTTGTG